MDGVTNKWTCKRYCFGRFRSYDPWVMSPIRFLCATKHYGASTVDRTRDLQIFSLTLSQLSYASFDVEHNLKILYI